jgi:hypothetical protein
MKKPPKGGLFHMGSSYSNNDMLYAYQHIVLAKTADRS